MDKIPSLGHHIVKFYLPKSTRVPDLNATLNLNKVKVTAQGELLDTTGAQGVKILKFLKGLKRDPKERA